MRLLDTHVHVWDASRLSYPWLAGAALAASYAPADIDRGEGLTTRMVFVEADAAPLDALGEARWVAGSGDAWPELAGIVAAADLRSADLAGRLDALAGVERVVGVRHLLQDEPAESWRPDALAAGLAELGRRGLTFDACVRHPQLPALADLLERAPATKVVLDHVGKPPVDLGVDSLPGRAWADAVKRLALLPHVHVKLSGLAAESADPAAYDRNADAFVAVAVEAFGPERAMIGSDWPVSAKLGAGTTLRAWVDRVRRATAATPAEWALLAERSGERFYGLS